MRRIWSLGSDPRITSAQQTTVEKRLLILMRIHKKNSLNKISARRLVTYKFTEVHHSKPCNLKAPKTESVAAETATTKEDEKNAQNINRN